MSCKGSPFGELRIAKERSTTNKRSTYLVCHSSSLPTTKPTRELQCISNVHPNLSSYNNGNISATCCEEDFIEFMEGPKSEDNVYTRRRLPKGYFASVHDFLWCVRHKKYIYL
jgi:hypothetical protein